MDSYGHGNGYSDFRVTQGGGKRRYPLRKIVDRNGDGAQQPHPFQALKVCHPVRGVHELMGVFVGGDQEINPGGNKDPQEESPNRDPVPGHFSVFGAE